MGSTTEVGARPARRRRLHLEIEPLVYGTVVLMTVLVVALDDGIDGFTEGTQLVIGPLIATAAAHLFAAVLASMNELGTRPSGAQFRRLLAHSAQYLVLAIVPVLLMILGAASGWFTPVQAVDLVLLLGLVLLVVLGGVGGRRCGGGWGFAVLCAIAAGLLGVLVLLLRIVLEH